ncbi:MAG: hypothetical protein ABI083_10640, partial [Lapillicoccus sp.]
HEVTAEIHAEGSVTLPIGPSKDHQAEAGVSFGAEKSWNQSHDATDGSSTYTTSGQFNAGAHAGADGVKAEVSGVASADMGITKDATGHVTQVQVTTTQEVSGGVSAGPTSVQPGGEASGTVGLARSNMDVNTLTVPVENDAQRAIVQQWMDRGGVMTPEMMNPDHRVPGDAFQNMLYDNASRSTVHYTNVTDTAGFSATVSAGAQFGIDYSLEVKDATATAGTYLGDSDGARRVETPLPVR